MGAGETTWIGRLRAAGPTLIPSGAARAARVERAKVSVPGRPHPQGLEGTCRHPRRRGARRASTRRASSPGEPEAAPPGSAGSRALSALVAAPQQRVPQPHLEVRAVGRQRRAVRAEGQPQDRRRAIMRQRLRGRTPARDVPQPHTTTGPGGRQRTGLDRALDRRLPFLTADDPLDVEPCLDVRARKCARTCCALATSTRAYEMKGGVATGLSRCRWRRGVARSLVPLARRPGRFACGNPEGEEGRGGATHDWIELSTTPDDDTTTRDAHPDRIREPDNPTHEAA